MVSISNECFFEWKIYPQKQLQCRHHSETGFSRDIMGIFIPMRGNYHPRTYSSLTVFSLTMAHIGLDDQTLPRMEKGKSRNQAYIRWSKPLFHPIASPISCDPRRSSHENTQESHVSSHIIHIHPHVPMQHPSMSTRHERHELQTRGDMLCDRGNQLSRDPPHFA